jgi:uncharacterized protein YndB with AHSA1/START domain
MDKPSFIYTTYIHTTPERPWRALTDPALTERYEMIRVGKLTLGCSSARSRPLHR